MNELARIPGVSVAVVRGVDADGRPRIQAPGEPGPPRPARALWTGADVRWADQVGREVLVGRLDGDADRPVVLGLLDAPPAAAAAAAAPPAVVRVEGRDEVVIECGQARIALRADGRVVIEGAHVVSRSTGANKLRGASVRIN